MAQLFDTLKGINIVGSAQLFDIISNMLALLYIFPLLKNFIYLLFYYKNIYVRNIYYTNHFIFLGLCSFLFFLGSLTTSE